MIVTKIEIGIDGKIYKNFLDIIPKKLQNSFFTIQTEKAEIASLIAGDEKVLFALEKKDGYGRECNQIIKSLLKMRITIEYIDIYGNNFSQILGV